jgi:dTDP-4-amino-4,6-dideoxygalactose transaminase
MIPFNKPYFTGNEFGYMRDALASGKISGDGHFTKLCHARIESLLGSGRSLLTTSCTDALEAAALLCDIQPGDEVIVPSYTFVSTANAFVLRGAKIRFIDSHADQPNLNESLIEELLTPRTRAIVPVHYAGVACDMDPITAIARKHSLRVVEDAAQAIDASYNGRPLGTLGDLAAFSFHETKNVIAGEGGSLHVNDPALIARAEVVREKGTNRSAFFRGEIDKYGWVDVGSSFLPSELTAAFLFAQLESLDRIQARRKQLWEHYLKRLAPLAEQGVAVLPAVPAYASRNGHMFYLVCDSLDVRTRLIAVLRANGILAVFHYQSLHVSRYFVEQHDGRALPQADRYTDCLVRLPLFYELEVDDVDRICDVIVAFCHVSQG